MCACSSLWAGGTAGSVPQDNTSTDWGAFCALRLSCGAQAAGHLLPGCQERAARWESCFGAPGQYCWVPHSSPRPCLGITPCPQPCCGKERLVEALVGTRICPRSHPSPGAEGHRAAHPGGVSARAPTPPLCASHSPEPPTAPFPLLPGELSPSQGAPLVLGLLRGVPTGLCRDPCARCAPLSFSPPQHPGTAEQLPDTASREG